MGLVHSPKIVTDGLVFAYDMGNPQKSWKGKPTTNQLLNPNNMSSGWSFNAASASGSKLIETTASSTHYILRNSSITSGLTYTQSVKAKAAERRFIQIAPSTGFSDASWTTFDLLTGQFITTGSDTATMEYLGNDEWLCSHTATATSTTSGRFTVAIVTSLSATRLEIYTGISGYGVFLRDHQLEVGDFPTPFVDGTRSTTQAISDMVGQNTITAFNLTYNSDGTTEFNGTSNYIRIEQQPLNYSPNLWTTCFWINPGNQYSRFITPNSASIDHWIEYENTTQRVDVQVTQAADTGSRNLAGTSGTVPINTWSYVAISINNLNVKIHVNGKLTNEYNETVSIAGWSRFWTIGQRGNGSGWFLGKLDNLMSYNRELTTEEIAQNFNALRGRYGI